MPRAGAEEGSLPGEAIGEKRRGGLKSCPGKAHMGPPAKKGFWC